MATIRLVPSDISVSNATYVLLTDVAKMKTNTDSTTYGIVTHNRASTNNTYYVYIKGFNFDDIPDGATVTDWEVKIKASATGHTTSTSTSYYMTLLNNTSSLANTYADGRLSTTLTTFTFPKGSITWEQIIGTYGENFGVRVPLRRASSNTADTVLIYGVEIEVTYTPATPPRTITTTLSGNGTISPSGATSIQDGEQFTVTITPTNKTDTVTVKNNNVDVSNNLVIHYQTGPSSSDDRVLGTYNLVSGSFNGSGASYFSGMVGKGYNGSTTTSNYYSGGSGVIAVFTYDMSFTLPAGSVVTNLYFKVNGHAENTSNASEYMCARLISGDTELTPELNFKDVGTSNSTQTIVATVMPTVEQVANMKLQCRLGYYGGAINGATCYIEYAVPTTDIDYYTYTYEVDGDATIAVVIGGSSAPKLYVKVNGTWTQYSKVFVKQNDLWIEQNSSTWPTLFDTSVNYRLKE